MIDGALVTYNNLQHFNHAPAAAGIKISRMIGLTIKNSDVENNFDATGLWLDESVRRFTLVNNRTRNNRNPIQAELSDTGIIANNVLDGGEYGVWLHNTGNVQIYNNAISNVWNRQIAMYQDARRQATDPNGRDPRMPVPDPTCPWLVKNIMIANNTFTNEGKYQIYAMDTQSHVSADAMHIHFEGNLFAYKATTSQASFVLWGAGDNRSKTIYETPAAFNAAKGVSWRNMQTLTGSATSTLKGSVPVSAANTMALPSAVAAVIGQAAGTKHLGTF